MSGSEWPGSGSEGCQTARNYYWGLLIAVVMFAGSIIIILSRRIVTLKRKRKSDGLYLQLVTDSLWENIRIGEVCVPSEQLYLTPQQKPLIVEVNLVLGCLQCEAWITWGRRLNASNVSVIREARSIALPRSVTISKRLARELESEQGYIKLARLVRQVGGLTSMIPLSTPMINGDGWSTIGEDLRVAETCLKAAKTAHTHKGKAGSKGAMKGSKGANTRAGERQCRRV